MIRQYVMFPNSENPAVKRDLGNLYSLHQTVARACHRSKHLFRVLDSPHLIVILANKHPNFPTGYAASYFSSRIEKHQAGEKRDFNLRANPTVKRNGKRHSANPADWITSKSKLCGFRLLGFRVMNEQLITVQKPSHRMTFYSVDFDGRLVVEDAALFNHALANGIGPAKAFGFGMLLTRRI